MKEFRSAFLYFENKPIVKLDLPVLRIDEGLVYIDCYIDKNFFSAEYEKPLINRKSYFDGKIYTIQAIEIQGSKIFFNQIILHSESYPDYKFSFLCYDFYTECIFVKEEKGIAKSKLKYILVEGIDMLFIKTSEKKRIRTMFGKDDSRVLSLELDNSEIRYSYFNQKRSYNLKIGLIKDAEKEKSVLINFFQDELIPYRIYQTIKRSLKYFLSYLCGNNVIIREEYYQNEHEHFTRSYSQKELSENNVNYFLPIHNAQFRHKGIVNDYANTFSNYLIWDRILNLSEIVYLINQSKQVNIESSFFILLIVIEKIANSLFNSGVIKKNFRSIIDDEKFIELTQILFQLIEDNLKGNASKTKIDLLKSKIGSINNLSKTENKIDMLLEFCEIQRTEEIDQLFPKLRNLAIHQGEISYDRKDSSKNYLTLFVLTNNIICNLIQYKGIRFIEYRDGTNHIAKKVDYKLNIENL